MPPARQFVAPAIIAILLLAYAATFSEYRRYHDNPNEGPHGRLLADLAQLNNAIDLYRVEHNGGLPSPALIDQQLTLYTDISGNVGPMGHSYSFGPYLLRVPALTVGPELGKTKIATAPAPGVAWIYNPQTGAIRANCDDQPTGPQFQVPPPTTPR